MNLKKTRLSTFISILFSIAVTASLLLFLIQSTDNKDWQFLFNQLNAAVLSLYISSYLISMILRAYRYQLLLHASNAQLQVSLYVMLLATFVRNLFVDLLPARIGALSYVVLLNKKFKLQLSSCLSSFTLSIIFDLFAMIPLIWFAIVIGLRITDKNDPLWFAPMSIVVLIISSILFLYVDRLCCLLGKIFAFLEQKNWTVKFIKFKKIEEILNQTADDINFIKKGGIFWKIMIISIFIRILKYVGLCVLLLSFLPHEAKTLLVNSFGWIFFGLIAAEASASLPISGIGGFGAYEWSLISVLLMLGMDKSIAGVASLALHLITQIIDYSLGGIALIMALLYKNRKAE